MNCFPVDEEILASIPFSNNSVVLAATSVLQQLLTLADERDLHSVDVSCIEIDGWGRIWDSSPFLLLVFLKDYEFSLVNLIFLG